VTTIHRKEKILRRNRSGIVSAVAVFLAILLTIPALVFAFVDQRVWPWDQAWYGEVAVDLWWTLLNQPTVWPIAMLNALGSKPPAVVWLAQFFVPIGQMVGSIETGLLLFQWLVATGTVLVSIRIGLKINHFDVKSAIFAGCVCAGAPLFAGITTQMFTENLQTFIVALFYLFCFGAARHATVWKLLIAALFLTCSVLVKITTPLYMLAALFILFKGEQFKTFCNLNLLRKSAYQHFTLAILSLGAITLSMLWYAYNIDTVIKQAFASTLGDVALNYGDRPSLIPKVAFWSQAFQSSFFGNVSAALMAVSVAIALICLLQQSHAEHIPKCGTPRRNLYLPAAQIILVLLILGSQTAEETRYLLPILPSVTVLFVYVFQAVRSASIRTFYVVISIISVIETSFMSLGSYKPPVPTTHWLQAPVCNDARKTLVNEIVCFTSNSLTDGRIQFVGYELPWFNANTFSFYSAKNRLNTNIKANYTSLGYAENDVNKAIERFHSINPTYYITLNPKNATDAPGFLNIVSKPVRTYVKNNKWFKLVKKNIISGFEIYQATKSGEQKNLR